MSGGPLNPAPGERDSVIEPETSSARLGWLAALLGIAVVASISLVVWRLAPTTPGSSSAEAGFLRDMSAHHEQAVEMASAIRFRTDDEQLHFLTTDIVQTQLVQIGMMLGWLDIWNLSPTGDDPPMTWMDHPITEGRMPGMAEPAEVDTLAILPVAEAETRFLRLMIRHHQGGVGMAQAMLSRTDQPEVTRLAEAIVAGQQFEIDAMNALLEARGEAPITDALPMATPVDGDDAHEGM
ncbi:MAG: DUF305 domain-containing protein [Chloroflexota bacterium]|nr:DUF305 domain-containing protein [Chloroflexota bacterium]